MIGREESHARGLVQPSRTFSITRTTRARGSSAAWPCPRCCWAATTPRSTRWRRAAAAEKTRRNRPDLPARAGGLSARKRPLVHSSAVAMNKTDLIEQSYLRSDIPDFRPGDTVKVHVRVVEGSRERVQVFQGVVIGRQNGGLRETFTVRKISFGVGVERTFPVHSPSIAKLEVVSRGQVRRAKLYYLRELRGKKARIKERRIDDAKLAAMEEAAASAAAGAEASEADEATEAAASDEADAGDGRATSRRPDEQAAEAAEASDTEARSDQAPMPTRRRPRPDPWPTGRPALAEPTATSPTRAAAPAGVELPLARRHRGPTRDRDQALRGAGLLDPVGLDGADPARGRPHPRVPDLPAGRRRRSRRRHRLRGPRRGCGPDRGVVGGALHWLGRDPRRGESRRTTTS